MSTEKPLPSPAEKELMQNDIKLIQEGFDKIFSESSEKKQLMLASHEDSGSSINAQEKNILLSIGFENTKNVEEFDKKVKELEEAGVKMATIEFLKKIKAKYNKDIISYNNLCVLCEKYNLYFGSSKLFIGKIPMENVKELAQFPLEEFKSHYYIVESRQGQSVVDLNRAYTAQTMIVAPITSFKLKDVVITASRELIPYEGVTSKYKSPCGEDPIVLLPFKNEENGELFFLVLTHWDHSKSLI